MFSRIANVLAPHYCCGCGKIGSVLCKSCKNDIVGRFEQRCVLCAKAQHRKPDKCLSIFQTSCYADARKGVAERLVNLSKFDSIRAGCDAQADLLNLVAPRLPDSTVLFGVPTISSHIRQRGYGHAERIAKRFADLRRTRYQQIVIRTNTKFVQHGSSRQDRLANAKKSYALAATPSPDLTYVIVDDVVTTGATVTEIAKLLKSAGARTIWCVATSKQM